MLFLRLPRRGLSSRISDRNDGGCWSIDCWPVGATITISATYSAALLIPEASNDLILASQQDDFEIWLRRRLAKNTPYDRLVRDVLVAPIQNFGSVVGSSGSPSDQLFYAAKRYQAENLAAGTARLFLGVSVECEAAVP